MSNSIENARLTGITKITEAEIINGLERIYLEIEPSTLFPIDLGTAKVWDSGQPLTATPGSDDLGLIAGTFGTSNLYLSAGDLKAAGSTTRRCRFTAIVPENYVAGQPLSIRLSAGMLTTVSDGTCTVDLEAYLVGRTTLKSGSDLVTTSATDMNSGTFADLDFVLTPTALEPGDVLDVRLSIVCADTATATAVTPAIGAIDIVTSIRG